MAGNKKDKNAPKRPCSGYILFCNDHRDELKKKKPDLKFNEVSSYLSEMWRDASDKVRTKYNELSEKDRERYHNEMKDYVPVKSESSKDKKDKKEKTDKPKRNPSGYILYCNSVRDKVRKDNPSSNPKEITKILAEMWNSLNEKDKIVFNEKSKNFVRKDEESQAKKSKRKETDSESEEVSKKKEKKDTKKEDKKEKKEEKKKDKKDKKKKKKDESESEEEVEYYEEYYTDDE